MKHYAFIDYATQIYLWVVGALALFFHNNSVPHWPWLLAGHALASTLLHLMIQRHASHPSGRVLDFIRHYYPIPLYIGLFRETGALNQMFTSGYLDPTLIRFETKCFGFQPSLEFMQAWPYLLVSELFYAAYFSYYLMIAGVGLVLFLRNRAQFFHFVSLVSFIFYICYLVYIFTPVMGPRIFYRALADYQLPADVEPAMVPDFPAAIQAGLLYQLMAFIYWIFEAPGAAFPSSHVAVAFCTVYFSWLYLPRIRWLHLAVALLLCVSTVYCRYHYVVDVVAGVLTAALLLPVGNWLFSRFESSRSNMGKVNSASLKTPLDSVPP